MKRVFIPLIAISILLSGCWDMVESEKLGLVTLIGIDSAENDQIKLIVHELSQPQKQSSGGQSGGGTASSPVKIHEAVAPTISEAIEMINASNYHSSYLAHATALVLSEELASSKGIDDFMDYFERTPEIRRNTWLLISNRGQFDKIFSIAKTLEIGNDTGKIIRGIIENKSKTSFITTISLGEFLNLFWETGSEPYTSGISLLETDIGKGSSETISTDLSIGNTAVFKKDKLVGWLDNNESMGLLWAKGGIKGGFIPVYLDNKEVLLRIVRMYSKIKPSTINGKIQINIQIHVISNIGETQINLDFTNNQVNNKVQDLQAETVKKQILAALDKSKLLDSDIFGFGNYFYGKYPNDWKLMESKGYDFCRNIEVNIDVDSIVNQVGLIKKTRKD